MSDKTSPFNRFKKTEDGKGTGPEKIEGPKKDTTNLIGAGGESTAVVRTGPPKSLRQSGPGTGTITSGNTPDLDQFRAVGKQARTQPARQGSAAVMAPLVGKKGGKALVKLDGTSSMGGLINNAKTIIGKVISTAEERGGSGIQVQIMVYRDYCDRGLILEESPLTNNPAVLEAWLSKIVAQGGGDIPEAIEYGLERKLEEGFDVVLIFGDAESHSVEELAAEKKESEKDDTHPLNKVQAPRHSSLVAADYGKKGVPIHCFRVGRSSTTKQDFEAIAKASGGLCEDMDSSDAMQQMAVMAILDKMKGKAAVAGYLTSLANSGALVLAGKRFGDALVKRG